MYRSIFSGLIFLFLLGCSLDDGPIDCSNIACTEDFRSFSLTITNPAGSPIALDRFEVKESFSGDDLTTIVSDLELIMLQETGMYPLYGDQFANKHQNKIVDIVFRGFMGADEVVTALFKVGADCCHTGIISGDLEIVIN